jgi:cell fate regulator YaaT (PSP1 superfamily)
MFRRLEFLLDHGPTVPGWGPPELAIHVGDQCVVRVDRTLDYGKVVKLEEVEGAPSDADRQFPTAVRRATLQDQSKASENALMSKMAHDTCAKRVAELNLEMHLIYVRYSFDRTQLTVSFMAEGRVDFRELVKRLAAELKTQVEMKQIGVRDTAKLIGGLGPCGQRLCCSRWLKTFDAVSVKMAKVQRLSLGPNTISGMCGRLKCCLRYEYECYQDLTGRLPRDGAYVKCPHGSGYVIDKDVLAQRVRVRMDDERILEFEVGDVTIIRQGPVPKETE